MNPFGTLPQYGMDYWPKDAKIIQVDRDARRLGLTRPVDLGICGDAKLAAADLLSRLQAKGNLASAGSKAEREARTAQHKAKWEETLDAMTMDGADSEPGLVKPRHALRELEKAMPTDAMVSTDIGNICSVSNSYLRFEQGNSFLAAMTFGNCGYSFPAILGAKVGRPDRPAVSFAGEGAWGMNGLMETLTALRENIPATAVVFNNGQWGAEKKNQVLWFGDRYVGTQLKNPSFAEVARSMGAEGIRVDHSDQVGDALKKSISNQSEGKTTVIEVMVTRELGDPFRRDAMKLPQRKLARYQPFSEKAESATGQPIDLKGKASPH